ncbi:MAG: hypothetical protein HY078_00470 [Elusimicrobia bacterium]|nr:hypothetical protein [Elusimicrobiota bacterium]
MMLRLLFRRRRAAAKARAEETAGREAEAKTKPAAEVIAGTPPDPLYRDEDIPYWQRYY